MEQGLVLGFVDGFDSHLLPGNVFVWEFVASDALRIYNTVTFKKNLQFCREKLLIHKLTPSTPLTPQSPPSILDVQAIEKTKEIALRGKRESRPYLWRDWFACLQAVIPIMPGLGVCVSMHIFLCTIPSLPPSSPPPSSESIHSQIYLCISLRGMEWCSCQMH